MGKKRAVAYIRVSTKKDEQKSSFENQKSFFLNYLSTNDTYTLVKLPTNDDGIYAEKGISGTKLTRPKFNEMLKDAGLEAFKDEETGKIAVDYKIVSKPKFDVILVKDTKRFARNTSADIILKRLRQNGVVVIFLDINKSSENLDDITVIQLFLALAESESLRLSTSVKFGYKEGARKGNIYMGGKIIGYDYIKKDNTDPYHTNILKINEKEKELVQRVFDMYTKQGLGHQRICEELYKEGYRNSKGKKYTRSTISRMLENEKYIGVNTAGRYTYGDVINRKQVEVDYNDETRVQARKATEELAQKGIVRIPPIISKEQFKEAQEIRESHRKKYNNDSTYHGKTDYAKKIQCGRCGSWYIATSRKYDKEKNIETRYYACSHRITYNEKNGVPKCNNPSIKECELDNLLQSKAYYGLKLENIEDLQTAGELCLETLKDAINKEYDNQANEISIEISNLKTEKERLIPLYAKGIYDEKQLDELTNEYNTKIIGLNQKYDMLINGNDIIRKKIKLIEELLKSADEDKNAIIKIIQTNEYPEFNRKKILADVDCISIDIYGNPSIEFKNQNEMNNAIDYLDYLRKTYE